MAYWGYINTIIYEKTWYIVKGVCYDEQIYYRRKSDGIT